MPDPFGGKRFTPEEDEQLRELRLKFPGYEHGMQRRGVGGLGTIARIMGRCKSSVQLRLVALAKRDEEEGRL